MDELPLGKATEYPDTYDRSMLAPIARRKARAALGLHGALPFRGVDIWNAWELTWLHPGGKPAIGVAEIRVPADSPNIVESKSLKLYLGSFAMSTYPSADDLCRIIADDLGRVTGAAVTVALISDEPSTPTIDRLPGTCIDGLNTECSATDIDPGALATIGSEVVEETLHSHLLRSLCPVTNQPDFGSLLVRYRGPRIDTAGLLKYIVSYRRHNDFHEACVERIFVDISECCGCEKLDVYARYNRRGGIDINPFRSNTRDDTGNPRLWRQ
jgi:7-cyano-7-deazaguanine reductase